MNERMNDRTSEWINEPARKRVSKLVNRWINERANGRVSKLLNEWMSEWLSEWVREWMDEWTNGSISQSINQSINQYHTVWRFSPASASKSRYHPIPSLSPSSPVPLPPFPHRFTLQHTYNRLNSTIRYDCSNTYRMFAIKSPNAPVSGPFLANVNYVRYMLSPVRLSVVRRLSVCNVRAPYSGIWNFGNISTPIGTLAICDFSIKILGRSSQGNSFVGGVKRKRGSRI